MESLSARDTNKAIPIEALAHCSIYTSVDHFLSRLLQEEHLVVKESIWLSKLDDLSIATNFFNWVQFEVGTRDLTFFSTTVFFLGIAKCQSAMEYIW